MITSIGIADVAADQKRYVELLRRTVRSTGATLIGDEAFPDDSHSLAKKVAREMSIAREMRLRMWSRT